ncbi:MAG: ZIP family metal transporter [Salibacteraceae bacterium]
MLLYSFSLLISLIAGVWFIVKPPQNQRWVYLFLSAGGAFLITVIFTHILPELFESIPEKAGYALLFGFVIQIILEHFSKGIEHGHSHSNASPRALALAYIALCIHAFIEGMPLADVFVSNTSAVTREMLIGITLHKIPVAITLAIMLKKSNTSVAMSLLLLLGFILSTPLGSITQDFLGGFTEDLLMLSLALTVGILLHVSTTILFESSDHHRLSPPRVVVILLGIMAGFLI